MSHLVLIIEPQQITQIIKVLLMYMAPMSGRKVKCVSQKVLARSKLILENRINVLPPMAKLSILCLPLMKEIKAIYLIRKTVVPSPIRVLNWKMKFIAVNGSLPWTYSLAQEVFDPLKLIWGNRLNVLPPLINLSIVWLVRNWKIKLVVVIRNILWT